MTLNSVLLAASLLAVLVSASGIHCILVSPVYKCLGEIGPGARESRSVHPGVMLLGNDSFSGRVYALSENPAPGFTPRGIVGGCHCEYEGDRTYLGGGIGYNNV